MQSIFLCAGENVDQSHSHRARVYFIAYVHLIKYPGYKDSIYCNVLERLCIHPAMSKLDELLISMQF